MIGIIDYGVGNLFSLKCSLMEIGCEVFVSSDERKLKSADRLILPGVGAFRDASEKLKTSGMGDLVLREAEAGKPILGICLGMQLLFEKSYEYGEYEGLGLLKGKVKPLRGRIPEELKIPQMGWNSLDIVKEHPLLKGIRQGEYVYFVHSYFADECEESLIASTEYGTEVTAVAAKGNVCGCQFHPEKSGETGLRILKNFAEVVW